MKVAVIIDTWFPFIGGGQINALEISKRLVSKNLQIDIITRNNGQDNTKLAKYLRVVKLGPRSNHNSLISQIIFIVRSFFYVYRKDYSLIHAHAFLPGITARFLMIFKGIPAVLTVHGTSINTKLNNSIWKFTEKFILTKILYSAQITVSQDFLKLKNINKKNYYVPNGVNIREFDNISAPKSKRPTMIFVGRLHKQKNLPTLLEAIKILLPTIPHLKLIIIGKGPEELKLKQSIRDLKLQKIVKMVGEKKNLDLIKLYKSSHLFILPSIYEGQPLTLLEAWASKLPVIMTKTGDCQFLVKNGRNGYLINDPLNAKEIAKTILEALKSGSLETLGQNGYNLVKEKFSWEKSTQETLKVYESLA